jgi:acetyltransferase-like isoleucine patch superfamily enzyme
LAIFLSQTQIADRVVIGAGAVVTKNIYEPGVYADNLLKKSGAYESTFCRS